MLHFVSLLPCGSAQHTLKNKGAEIPNEIKPIKAGSHHPLSQQNSPLQQNESDSVQKLSETIHGSRSSPFLSSTVLCECVCPLLSILYVQCNGVHLNSSCSICEPVTLSQSHLQSVHVCFADTTMNIHVCGHTDRKSRLLCRG